MLFWASRYADARRELDRTRELEPESPQATLIAAYIDSKQGRHGEAIASYLDYLSAAEIESEMSPTLAYFYAAAGKRAEALAILKKKAPGEITPAQMGWVQAALGEKDEAFASLGKAIDQRANNVIWIRSQPWFDPLRDDPRFEELVRRMNLTD